MIFTSEAEFFADPTKAPHLARQTPTGHISTLGSLRRRSPEADFGWRWRGGTDSPVYRLSFMAWTGELYLIKLAAGGKPGTFDLEKVVWPRHTIQVIGQLPPDGDSDWKIVNDTLRGYAKVCGTPYSLTWIRERLGRHNAFPIGQR